MSRPVEKPMHLHARTDRAGAKVAGPLTIVVGVALISLLNIGDIIGGLIFVYVGLAAWPATRVKVTRGVLGFTKWRAYGARVLWFFGIVIGLIAAYPY